MSRPVLSAICISFGEGWPAMRVHDEILLRAAQALCLPNLFERLR
jgi:hypothetical protein